VADANIFCNTPWYEAHIYWDGGLGICCQESRRLSTTHNIKTTSLREWFNSEPVKQLRQEVLSDTPTEICSRCYHEEQHSGTSRRHRSNQKSVIFTKTAFQNSFEQSPGRRHFTEDGITDTLPIDLHIDLGNYCNLACKMCWSGASSRIASQYVKWGHEDHRQYLGTDWTKDSTTWNRFLDELLTIPKLKNIHFMGGETLLTTRFEEFVDFMILHQRSDLSISFVTNGTTFNESLINKLKQFTRVGIEVSIETTTAHNDYVRQGTNTKTVLENIKLYQQHCNNTSISLTLRPAVSALTVGYYYTLLEYCLEQKLTIKSLLVTTPSYLNVNILPKHIKEQYSKNYHDLLEKLVNINIDTDYNESDPNDYLQSIKLQVQQILSLLEQSGSEEQLKDLVGMCRSWDSEFNFNARTFYPELAEIFTQYGY
jgi:sulfatase maturation enzyme AslB (radical SAM superfamily)